MLESKVYLFIAGLNYMTQFDRSLDGAMDRVLDMYIYNPRLGVSPMERVRQIREALASDEKLSEIVVPPELRRSEETVRAFLSQLADRIEALGLSAPPKYQRPIELTEKILEKLRFLLQPLAESSTLDIAIEQFVEKALPDLKSYHDLHDTEVFISYVLRHDTNEIRSVVTPKTTDSMFREYLHNVALIIENQARSRKKDIAE
jgi:hypothetical protein